MLLFTFFFSLSACTHKVKNVEVTRMPQSEQTKDCGKRISEYTDESAKFYFKNFPSTQKKQLQIMGTYLYGLKSQIARLMYGIEYETRHDPKNHGLSNYKLLLNDLVFKSAYITALYYQFKKVKVEELCFAFSFNKVALKEESFLKVIEEAEKAAEEEGILTEVAHDFAKDLAKDILKNFAKEAYYGAREEIIQYIAWSGIKSIARESLAGIAGEIIIGAARGAVITLITQPLKGGTIPEWTKWQKILSASPEIALNPEWMKKAGLSTMNPWMTHMLAFQKDAERMNKLSSKLYNYSENSFTAKVREISMIDQSVKDQDLKNKFPTAYAESTGVNKPVTKVGDDLPFWAIKK